MMFHHVKGELLWPNYDDLGENVLFQDSAMCLKFCQKDPACNFYKVEILLNLNFLLQKNTFKDCNMMTDIIISIILLSH